jgi:hypothetical protein
LFASILALKLSSFLFWKTWGQCYVWSPMSAIFADFRRKNWLPFGTQVLINKHYKQNTYIRVYNLGEIYCLYLYKIQCFNEKFLWCTYICTHVTDSIIYFERKSVH